MKALILVLLALLGLFQYRLWVGDGSLSEVWYLRRQIQAQVVENEDLKARNAELEAEVRDLKEGLDAIEERARSELGMVKKDETFYMVVDE